MKKHLFLFLSLLSSCGLGQQPNKDDAAAKASEPQSKNVYVDEAPLPEGWPTPGPYDAVAEKKYPAYRAAYTSAAMDGLAFWTLFSHIKRNDIPMTAPVEKTMSADADMKMSAMGFLYQNEKVGTIGADGKKVEVKDVAATRVLTYTWMGDDSDENVKTARTAIDAELTKRGITATQYRIMGYNGPQTPRNRKTWELHAVLP
jgi:hypothetical protein